MYEIFDELCKERGITPYQFCKETGVNSSTISTWKKNGRKCSPKTAEIVCNYFGISMDYLMNGKEIEEKKYYTNDKTADIAQKIFQSKELRVLFDAAKDAEPDDLNTVYQMLLALKRKERGDDN